MSEFTMDVDTDYVHTAVINWEPTYLALADAVDDYQTDRADLQEARDTLRLVLDEHAEAMGLTQRDIDEADISAMIQWESENSD